MDGCGRRAATASAVLFWKGGIETGDLETNGGLLEDWDSIFRKAASSGNLDAFGLALAGSSIFRIPRIVLVQLQVGYTQV